jgi:hypothetical protein
LILIIKSEVNCTYFKWFDITVAATTATRQLEGEWVLQNLWPTLTHADKKRSF